MNTLDLKEAAKFLKMHPQTVRRLAKAGRLRPSLHPERFPLERAREALSLLDDRAVWGKVIVEP